jgi:hypothetical protein
MTHLGTGDLDRLLIISRFLTSLLAHLKIFFWNLFRTRSVRIIRGPRELHGCGGSTPQTQAGQGPVDRGITYAQTPSHFPIANTLCEPFS